MTLKVHVNYSSKESHFSWEENSVWTSIPTVGVARSGTGTGHFEVQVNDLGVSEGVRDEEGHQSLLSSFLLTTAALRLSMSTHVPS